MSCVCPIAGWCERHKVFKTELWRHLCQTDSRYFRLWEDGNGPALARPPNSLAERDTCSKVVDTKPGVRKQSRSRSRSRQVLDQTCEHRGSELRKVECPSCLGRVQVKTFICSIHVECQFSQKIKGVKCCNNCSDRKPISFSRNSSLIKPITFEEPIRRNLLLHIWPVRGSNIWKWNCDQILRRAELFNGRRIVAIVADKESHSAEEVKEYLRDFTDEFLIFLNDRKLGEVVSFIPLLEKVESLDPNEVTFRCHAKGVKYKLPLDTTDKKVSTVFKWTEAMYETNLDDWDQIKQKLQKSAMVGSFLRTGTFGGFYKWHYSGAFYWFRNRDVFQRNWRYVDQKYYGAESWPGYMFKQEEVDWILNSRKGKVGDLYGAEYWEKEIQPELERWRKLRQIQLIS